MSFIDDGQEFSKRNRPALLMGALVTLALCLGLIVLVWELGRWVVNWWQKPDKFGVAEQRTLDLNPEELFSFRQFEQMLPGEAEEEEEVYLNLDPQLLADASASAKERWWLELNVDQEGNRLNGVGGWKNLLKVHPEMWRYLLIYQQDQENVVGYDLRILEEKPILNLEQARSIIDQSGASFAFSLPIDQLEILGIVDDQLYVYAHNALDEGTILFTDYADQFEQWQVWPQVKGKLARAAGQSFLLQGFQEGCSAIYTFDKIAGKDKKLERMAITYNGCVEGERFLGVDSQGRLLLADVKKEGATGLNLDLAGNYADLIAVPISEPADRTRILMSQEMPSGVHNAAFFPGNKEVTNITDQVSGENVVVVDETAQNSTESGDVANGVRVPYNEGAEWRAKDQLVLVSEGGVWTVRTDTGELRQVANLMNMFGRPVIKSWHDETLCLEMVDKPQLSQQERMISIDLDTGVPISGMEVCLRQTEADRPYVSRNVSQEEKEKAVWRDLFLPVDFRLVKGKAGEMASGDRI